MLEEQQRTRWPKKIAWNIWHRSFVENIEILCSFYQVNLVLSEIFSFPNTLRFLVKIDFTLLRNATSDRTTEVTRGVWRRQWHTPGHEDGVVVVGETLHGAPLGVAARAEAFLPRAEALQGPVGMVVDPQPRLQQQQPPSEDVLSDWVTDWLADRLTGWPTDWLVGWLADWQTYWQTLWHTCWLNDEWTKKINVKTVRCTHC